MKIRFNRDHRHSENGFEVNTYQAGTVVDVSESCAKSAISAGAGIPDEGAPETKSKGAAPKNKGKE